MSIITYIEKDCAYLTFHLPCLKTPIRSDLSASKSHHSAGTSEWSGSGTQTSMSLRKNKTNYHELKHKIEQQQESHYKMN